MSGLAAGSHPRRKDIEGLRAVAILLVVLAHARVPFLAGGFVGVDVFFVISGYLITGILLRSAGERQPSLLDFYARRLRRLLPALLVLQLATIVLAAIVLAPREQLDQVAGAKSAVVWLSNFQFALGELHYFGASAGEALFLHTWSLGVEEQFYLVWPVLIFFVAGVYRPTDPGQQRRKAWRLLALLALLGLGFSILQTFIAPLQAYYLLPARFWQFALGGALAAWHTTAVGGETPTAAARMALPVGLLGIAASALLLDGSEAYPGAWALLPTLGTAFVLAAGQASGGSHGLLASAPLQWIGRYSYGWYLWHWPLLLLGRSLYPAAGVAFFLLLSAMALAIAVLSFRFVEAPLRYSRRLAGRPWLSIGFAVAGMLTGVLAAQQWQEWARARSQTPAQSRPYARSSWAGEVYARGCDDWYRSSRVVPCAWGPPEAPTVVLLGDSVGAQWFPALRRIFPEPQWRLLVVTKSACPIVDASFHYARLGRTYVECDRWRRAAVDLIKASRTNLVIVGSGSFAQFDDRTARDGSRRILAELSTALPVVVLAPTPSLAFDGTHCIARREWRPAWLPRADDSCTAPLAEAAREREARLLRESVASLPNVHLVVLDDVVCPQGLCRAEMDGQIVFDDAQHLTGQFTAKLAPTLLARIEAAMSGAGETLKPACRAGTIGGSSEGAKGCRD